MSHTLGMGRHKGFSRDQVLEKALPVFWKHGFADASLQALEQATGVRKSGLYAEFRDKADLYLESLRFYLKTQQQRQMLEALPLGWKNIENFLKLAPTNQADAKGCFSVSSIREVAILPSGTEAILIESRSYLKKAIAANLRAEAVVAHDADAFAELILTFFTGDSLEVNLRSAKPTRVRKIDRFLTILRGAARYAATS